MKVLRWMKQASCLRPPVTLYPNSIAFACLIEGRLKELSEGG